MTDSYTQLNVGSGGSLIDEEAITYPDTTVRKRSRIEVCGADQTQIAIVGNTTPVGTEYGLVTRNIPSGTQTIQTIDINGAVTPVASDESIIYLRRIAKLLESLGVVDITTNQQRVFCIQPTAANLNATVTVSGTPNVSVTNVPAVTINSGTITTVSTVTTVSTLSAITTQPVDQRYEMMDRAAINFANSIRSQLTF